MKNMNRFVFLDILRGMAILGVIWHHAYFGRLTSRTVNFDIFDIQIYPFIFNNGWLGVNAFFVLSGFVLFNPNFLDKFDAKRFYVKRFLRLIPLYLFFIVIIGIVSDYSVPYVTAHAILLITGVHDVIPSMWAPRPFLWVFWSLGVEILFSIGLPVFILAFRHFGFWKIIITVILFSMGYKIVADILHYQMHPDFENPLINPLKDNIFGRIDDFAVGMAASFVFHKGWRPSPHLIWGAVVVLLATLYAWNGIYAVTGRPVYISVLASVLHPAFSLSLSILILWLLPKRGWQNKSFMPLVILGHVVYSAYIIHAFLLKIFDFDFSNIFSALLYMLLIYTFSIILFLLIEVHGISKKPRWTAIMWAR